MDFSFDALNIVRYKHFRAWRGHDLMTNLRCESGRALTRPGYFSELQFTVLAVALAAIIRRRLCKFIGTLAMGKRKGGKRVRLLSIC